MPSWDLGWSGPRQLGAWLDGSQAAWLQAFRTGAGGPQRPGSGPETDDASIAVRWMFAGQIIRDPVILMQDLANIDFPDGDVGERCNRFSMLRGRRASYGAVLMPKFALDAIKNPQRCIHTLAIECQRTAVIQRLCVVHVEAVCANVVEGASVREMATRDLHPNTPMIVTISDARYYAGMSSITDTFNWRTVAGELLAQRSYRDLAIAIFDEELEPIFGLPLLDLTPAKDNSENAPPEPFPESLEFQGLSAWDAFWIVLDLAGWSFSLGFDGQPRLFEPKMIPDTQAIFLQLNTGANRATRWDTKGEVLDTALPEKIRACTLQKDYQFQNDPDGTAIHSGDMAARYPTYEQEFDSRELLNNDEDKIFLGPEAKDQQDKKMFAPGTKEVVWGTVPLLVDDSGIQVNSGTVRADLRFVALRYLRNLARLHRGWTWYYSVIWQFFPNSHVAAVGFSDVGGEFTCQVAIGDDFAIDWIGNELGWNGELCRPGPPKSRSNVPYGRELYGTLVDWFPPYELSPGDEEGAIPPLPPGRAGLVQLDYGRILTDEEDRGVELAWTTHVVVTAFNGMDRSLRMGRRIYGKWNYQLGTSGEWVIITSGKPDYVAECGADGESVDRIVGPDEIVLDKRRMLRLVEPTGPNAVRNQAIISMYAGPPFSVLHSTPDPETPIVWDTCPTLQALNLLCFLKVGDDQITAIPGTDDLPPQPAAAEPQQTWLGPSRIQDTKIRLPPPPQRSDQFLVSGPSQGDKTELNWAKPGLDGTLIVQNIYSENVELRFEKGVLVYSSDTDAFELPPKQYGVEFDDCPCEQFNPCEEDRAGTDEPNRFCVWCEGEDPPASLRVVIRGAYEDAANDPAPFDRDPLDVNGILRSINGTWDELRSVSACLWRQVKEFTVPQDPFPPFMYTSTLEVSLAEDGIRLSLSVALPAESGVGGSVSQLYQWNINDPAPHDCQQGTWELSPADPVLARWFSGRNDFPPFLTIGWDQSTMLVSFAQG